MDSKRWFFSWLAGPTFQGEVRRGVIQTAAKWPNGSVIRVSFLLANAGDADLMPVVMQHAQEWLTRSGANLRFEQVDQGGEIRVSFHHPGSWSTIGITCRDVPADQPTTNFGWLRDADAAKRRRVVLHEFGHVLGLLHEHQSPTASYVWNKRQVLTDLKAQGWTAQDADRNLFVRANRQETQFTEFDPDSIMIYPLPALWLLRGTPVELQTDLSARDVSFLREQYPPVAE